MTHRKLVTWLVLIIISIGAIFSTSVVASDTQDAPTTKLSPLVPLLGTLATIITIIGSTLGIIVFIRKAIVPRLQYLYINLELSVVEGFVLAATIVENKGSQGKKIENAIILVGPEHECLVKTANLLLPDSDIKYTNDLEFVEIDEAKYDDAGRAVIPVTFYFNENVNIADERIGYDVPINTDKVANGVPYAVRFFIFGEKKLHRSTQKTFIISNTV